MSKVIIWDFDHTILNTERQLFGPVLRGVAADLHRDVTEVECAFNEANTRTFAWKEWLMALGMDEAGAADAEAKWSADIAARAESCLYPGIIETLQRYRGVARQVLVTAGDPPYQAAKFSWLPSLQQFFAPEDRHFVPLHGSKADAVAKYEGRIVMIDDSPTWHLEVINRGISAVHIRPQWFDTSGVRPHDGDDVQWRVVCTMDDLRNTIDEAMK